MPPKENSHVFRDPIEEHREEYTVTYQPADACSAAASLSIHFHREAISLADAAKAMEAELELWLKKFPVPLRVSAFDGKRKLIRHSPHPAECHLSGYVRQWDSGIVRRWHLLSDQEFPAEFAEPAYLERAYQKIPFRVCEEERERKARRRLETVQQTAASALFLLIIPIIIYVVRTGEAWIAVALGLLSIGWGAYTLTGLTGWRKPSPLSIEREKQRERMAHYFHHCERNPEAFAQLKQHNLEQEVLRERQRAQTRAHAASRTGFPLARRILGAARAFRAAG
jgi:hypothetical protein